MNPPLIPDLLPAGFRFEPQQGHALRGPAFSPFFKLLASVLALGCIVWFVHLYSSGQLTLGTRAVAWLYVLGGLGILGWTLWHIWRSETELSSQHLFQSWIWDKKVPINDLVYAKLIRIRGLEWLVAPRLYVRTMLGKFALFYIADPQVLSESERLVRELSAFRKPF